MLPGFRFLFGAVVLSVSILVFGFGAAALLRTAHEEFTSTPSWQPAPETRFAQSQESQASVPLPVLALLRVDDLPKEAATEPAKTEKPASNDAVTTGAADQSAVPSAPTSSPNRVVALQPAASTPIEPVKPEPQTVEAPVASGAPQVTTPAPAETLAVPDAAKLATIEPAPSPAIEAAPIASAEAVAAAPEQPNPPGAPEPSLIETRIATLGGPPVPIASPAAKPASVKSDADDGKKRKQARREKRRHSAARARSARQAQVLDAFGQPTTTTTATR